MRFLAAMGRSLSIPSLVDLGELTPGHHVWITGIEDDKSFITLHYEMVPAVRVREIADARGGFHWKLLAQDDLGNAHAAGDTGSLDAEGSGPSCHGLRRIGNVSPEVSKLFLRFGPARASLGVVSEARHATVDLRAKTLSVS